MKISVLLQRILSHKKLISKINLLAHQNLKEKYTEAKTLIKNSFIFFHKLKNGTIRTVEVNSSPIETESGLILFSIIKDVTKEQEKDLE